MFWGRTQQQKKQQKPKKSKRTSGWMDHHRAASPLQEGGGGRLSSPKCRPFPSSPPASPHKEKNSSSSSSSSFSFPFTSVFSQGGKEKEKKTPPPLELEDNNFSPRSQKLSKKKERGGEGKGGGLLNRRRREGAKVKKKPSHLFTSLPDASIDPIYSLQGGGMGGVGGGKSTKEEISFDWSLFDGIEGVQAKEYEANQLVVGDKIQNNTIYRLLSGSVKLEKTLKMSSSEDEEDSFFAPEEEKEIEEVEEEEEEGGGNGRGGEVVVQLGVVSSSDDWPILCEMSALSVINNNNNNNNKNNNNSDGAVDALTFLRKTDSSNGEEGRNNQPTQGSSMTSCRVVADTNCLIQLIPVHVLLKVLYSKEEVRGGVFRFFFFFFFFELPSFPFIQPPLTPSLSLSLLFFTRNAVLFYETICRRYAAKLQSIHDREVVCFFSFLFFFFPSFFFLSSSSFFLLLSSFSFLLPSPSHLPFPFSPSPPPSFLSPQALSPATNRARGPLSSCLTVNGEGVIYSWSCSGMRNNQRKERERERERGGGGEGGGEGGEGVVIYLTRSYLAIQRKGGEGGGGEGGAGGTTSCSDEEISFRVLCLSDIRNVSRNKRGVKISWGGGRVVVGLSPQDGESLIEAVMGDMLGKGEKGGGEGEEGEKEEEVKNEFFGLNNSDFEVLKHRSRVVNILEGEVLCCEGTEVFIYYFIYLFIYFFIFFYFSFLFFLSPLFFFLSFPPFLFSSPPPLLLSSFPPFLLHSSFPLFPSSISHRFQRLCMSSMENVLVI